MKIGIDFGTTHTTAAYFNGERLQPIPLDLQNRDPHLLRTMLYITREHEVVLGLAAVHRYLEDNTGRLAVFVPKVVGTVENTVARMGRHPLEPDGPITFIQEVIIEEDVGAPGRLLQSIKTALRDHSYTGTTIYDRFYTIQELIAEILRHVKQQAEFTLAQPVSEVMLGRPVRFADDPVTDTRAEQRLREAAMLAGFSDVSFLPEPVAAAHFYTRQTPNPQTVLVFDFGGGTLDLTVMSIPAAEHNGHARAQHFQATEGVLVGGDDFDSAIMRDHVARSFGVESHIDSAGHPFPAHLAGKLYQWQTIPELSKMHALPLIRRARRFGNNPAGFTALETLVTKNYGFALFENIERAKRRLSTATETTITMQAEDINLSVPLTRAQFQASIGDGMAQVQRGLSAILQAAGLAPEAISVVVTTGGSSLIPIFQQILRRRFAAADHVHSDTFGSVAAGLAIQAHAHE